MKIGRCPTKKFRNGDDDLRDLRQLVFRSEIFENIFERGNDPAEKNAADGEKDEADDARVHHRAAKLTFELHGFFVVDREALQNRVENSARLTRLHEVAVETVEDARMSSQRFAERLALLDLRFDIRDDDGKMFVVGLVAENVETLDDRQACVDHRREQTRERDEIFLRDAAAERKPGEPFAFLFDLRRLELLLAESVLNRLCVVGLHLTGSNLAGWAARFPDPLRHD